MFLETPRFPEDLSYYAQGGPEYNTTVIAMNSGYEQRNENWLQSRNTYSINQGLRTQNGPLSLSNAIIFFRAVKGKLIGFRFKDFSDFSASVQSGILDNGIGTGQPVQQLSKKYISGALSEYRTISKPVVGTLQLFRNGSLKTVGSNYSIDFTTGKVTWIADASIAIISVTTGSNPVVTTSATHPFTNGQTIYLTGLNAGSAINNKAFLISSVTATTFIINTTNQTNVTTGSALLYPQPTDFLTAQFEFDVPCRFDTDSMSTVMGDGGLFEWNSLSIVEIRV